MTAAVVSDGSYPHAGPILDEILNQLRELPDDWQQISATSVPRLTIEALEILIHRGLIEGRFAYRVHSHNPADSVVTMTFRVCGAGGGQQRVVSLAAQAAAWEWGNASSKVRLELVGLAEICLSAAGHQARHELASGNGEALLRRMFQRGVILPAVVELETVRCVPRDAAPKVAASNRKPATINQQMLAELTRDPHESMGLSAREWATKFGCSPATVHATDAWKAITKMRDKAKSELENRTNGR